MTKKIAGIVRQKWSPIESRFYFEALRFYDEVIYIDPRLVTYELDRDDNSLHINYFGTPLNNLSMLYTFGYAKETLLLAKSLHMCGCPTSDPYEMISRDSIDKLNDLLKLHNAGVGTTAFILPSIDAAMSFIASIDANAYPLIRKPVAGNRGRGIRKLDNYNDAIKLCESHFSRGNDVLLIEKYMNFEHEYRVYVVDGQPIEAYERVKAAGRIASNIYQGGSNIVIEDDNVKTKLFDNLSTCILDQFGIGIYGIDIGITDDGNMHIIEVNRTPGFGGLRRLKLLNFPRRAHEIIHARCRIVENENAGDRSQYYITFLGDTNPGHSYQEKLSRKGTPSLLETRGYDSSFENFRELLASSDFTLANLEVCLTDHRQSVLEGRKSYLDHADPTETADLLKAVRVSAVSLANNHAMDFGEPGLVDTLDAMKRAGIDNFGAGVNAREAGSVLFHRVPCGGKTVECAFVGGYELKGNYRSWGYYAGDDTPGVNLWSEGNAGDQIAALRREHPHVYIVACPHWGSSYEHVTEAQRRLSKVLIDSGADLIIGHGSHMLQEIRKYKGKWIVYSLGNFIYNSPGRFAKFKITPFSIIARLHVETVNGRTDAKLNLYPIQSDNKKTAYQPDFVSTTEFDKVMRFYMPTKLPRDGIQSLVRCGRDNFGYYMSLNLAFANG